MLTESRLSAENGRYLPRYVLPIDWLEISDDGRTTLKSCLVSSNGIGTYFVVGAV